MPRRLTRVLTAQGSPSISRFLAIPRRDEAATCVLGLVSRETPAFLSDPADRAAAFALAGWDTRHMLSTSLSPSFHKVIHRYVHRLSTQPSQELWWSRSPEEPRNSCHSRSGRRFASAFELIGGAGGTTPTLSPECAPPRQRDAPDIAQDRPTQGN
jgi:hypothetical protein